MFILNRELGKNDRCSKDSIMKYIIKDSPFCWVLGVLSDYP